ncbi:unnamed protein product [Protopolystoma xenopodis]|uniref:Tubulin--tyrosine ligase-like protein 9 n=1 Tax=Protopolystoma xenopodis TaxID=117903 RepID=A0A448WC06_9PLAT|nr:unnamed protein product [Protopolystoma xenopodis]
MRPWLLEVNSNPALSKDCPVDGHVKRSLIQDLLHLLNLTHLSTISHDGLRLSNASSSMRQSADSLSSNKLRKTNKKRACGLTHASVFHTQFADTNSHCLQNNSGQLKRIPVDNNVSGTTDRSPLKLSTLESRKRIVHYEPVCRRSGLLCEVYAQQRLLTYQSSDTSSVSKSVAKMGDSDASQPLTLRGWGNQALDSSPKESNAGTTSTHLDNRPQNA